MKRTVLPLIGSKSLRALNAFHALVLGMKMLPAYQHIDYVTFHESLKEKTEAQKETFLREAVAFVQLATDELEAIVSFSTDANGIPLSAMNIKNMTPADLHEIIVAVCMEITRIKIDLVSDDEKKNLKTSPLTSADNI